MLRCSGRPNVSVPNCAPELRRNRARNRPPNGIQSLLSINPAANLQLIIDGATANARVISTGLQVAGHDLVVGIQGLPATFQTAFRDLLAGNNVAAIPSDQHRLGERLPAGLRGRHRGTGWPMPVPIIPPGPRWVDLAPVLAIPGQIAQNFTNVVNTLTNFQSTITGSLVLTFGLPLQVVFDSIGMPINTLSALNSSSVAFMTALQAGNAWAAPPRFSTRRRTS